MSVILNVYLNFIRRFPEKLLNKLYLLVPFLGVVGIMEVASIASLIPLMSIVLDKNKIITINNFLGLNLEYNQMLIVIVISIISIFTLKGIFSLYIYRYTYKFVANAKSYLQIDLFYHYLHKDIQFYLISNSSDYIRNITTECNIVEARFIMPLLVLLAEVIPLSCLLIFIIYLNPLGILLSAILFVLIGSIITKITSPILKKYAKRQISSDGEMIKNAQQAFNSIKEVLLYSQQETFTNEFKINSQQSADCISNGLFINSLPRYILEIIAIICVFIIGGVAFLSGLRIEEIFVQMGVFLAALVKILPSANKIVAHFQALSYAKPSIENYLNAITEGEVFIQNYQDRNDSNDLGQFRHIKFSNVSFAYQKRSIINNFNFQIKSGEVIGIVGKTGSGKSTLINLILGLLSSDEGQISINGQPLNSVKRAYQRKIGYVPQETYLLDDSLFHNVTFYRDSNFRNAKDRVRNLFHEMDLDELLETNEELDRYVGEQGGRISGGQRQRVGIARALYLDPEIIILDEATSALDKVTERKIINYVMKYKGKKTIIMIAHRESTLDKCDHIIHLNHGEIIID